ncbi:DUF1289 domain-containing protein [Lysobacter sp. CAU 1642]|uniref:DUF1289 domain-containing protein n=1 Tax=Pseudomarimonas salicorniae TaxID=2933270 RepID=A0ABT0GIY1_9GAMM|nr:DUF1289 domain-containing protein [Lysobacter sp. CAU 1642]
MRQCCLDEADVCLGCGRHVDEILAWHAADAIARRAILERAAQRRRARAQRRHDSNPAPTDGSARPFQASQDPPA